MQIQEQVRELQEQELPLQEEQVLQQEALALEQEALELSQEQAQALLVQAQAQVLALEARQRALAGLLEQVRVEVRELAQAVGLPRVSAWVLAAGREAQELAEAEVLSLGQVAPQE